jgi:hypothetical protein
LLLMFINKNSSSFRGESPENPTVHWVLFYITESDPEIRKLQKGKNGAHQQAKHRPDTESSTTGWNNCMRSEPESRVGWDLCTVKIMPQHKIRR